jgi:hypothetical protein
VRAACVSGVAELTRQENSRHRGAYRRARFHAFALMVVHSRGSRAVCVLGQENSGHDAFRAMSRVP